jgi:hypothetical protein
MDKQKESQVDTGVTNMLLRNETDIDDKRILAAIEEFYPQIARNDIATLDDWSDKFRRDRSGGLVGQDKYLAPVKIFEQFRSAAKAARDDDIVANYLETTEQLAFKRVDVQSFSDDEEENSIWHQIKDHMMFEQKCRQIWRELGIISQCYVGILWGRQDFRVKHLTTSTGKKSKKVYKNILVPDRIFILDPCKVLPVGELEEELVYIASDAEATDFRSFLAQENTIGDKVFEQWIEGEYKADMQTLSLLQEVIGDRYTSVQNNLFRLNKKNVFRITSTKPDYQRFADVRLMSVFNWLDLKHNLQESDRADILGNLNAIIVVRRGDKDRRPSPEALAQTAAQMQQSARLPIMVGDDTLDIEIITRDKNYTLQAERYNAIDSRVTARLYQAIHTGNYAVGTAADNSAGLFKVISASMEARRDDIIKVLQKRILDMIYEMNDKIQSEPIVKLRRISLDFDPHWAKYVFDLYALDQVSHETVLEEVDLDIRQEVLRKRKEMTNYSDVFLPPGKPNTGNPGIDGRIAGGNNNGGGTNQESFNNAPKSGITNTNDEI